jgi:hypothetical protein
MGKIQPVVSEIFFHCKGCPGKNVPIINLIFVINQLLGMQSSNTLNTHLFVGDWHKNAKDWCSGAEINENKMYKSTILLGHPLGRLHVSNLDMIQPVQ